MASYMGWPQCLPIIRRNARPHPNLAFRVRGLESFRAGPAPRTARTKFRSAGVTEGLAHELQRPTNSCTVGSLLPRLQRNYPKVARKCKETQDRICASSTKSLFRGEGTLSSDSLRHRATADPRNRRGQSSGHALDFSTETKYAAFTARHVSRSWRLPA